jgi:uncharacterized membrane protein YdcZ (DUF606 family)
MQEIDADAHSGAMERLVAVVATIAVGAVIAFQPPVNSQLGAAACSGFALLLLGTGLFTAR